MGFLPSLFPPRLLGQLRPLLSARPPALHPSSLSQPPWCSLPLLSPPLSPPPTPHPATALPPSFPDAIPLWGGGFCAGDRQKVLDGLRGRPLCSSPPRGPSLRGRRAAPPLPTPAEVWGVRAPEASSFPGFVRANCSAAGAEPLGASNTNEGTGRRWGEDAPRTKAALSVPTLGNRQPNWGD